MSPTDLIGSLTGKDRGRFDREPLCEQHDISHPRACSRNDFPTCTFPKQRAHHDGTRDRVRDFAVAAAQRDMQPTAGRMKSCKQAFHRRGRRGTSREQHRGQKPFRRRPHRRQIVGVDQQGVGADLLRHKGDGIGLGDEHFVPDANRRRIQPDPRTYHDLRVPCLGKRCKEPTKKINRNFSYRQRRSCRPASAR